MATKITLNDISNATALSDGTGTFDVLIKTVERRIENQFAEGRITGADYANVYLGAMQAVLQQSIAFLLAQEKAQLENAVLTGTLAKQWGYNITTDADGNISLGTNIGTGLIDEQVTQAAQQTDLLIGQTAKAYAEVALLAQKQETELAQTSDPSGGLLLAQKNLYEAQIKGFEGKHKNELIKHMLDTWAVIYSITDGSIPTDVGTPDFLEKQSPGGDFTMPDLDSLVAASDALFP